MAGKQARSFKWECCKACGAEKIVGKMCEVCVDIKNARLRAVRAKEEAKRIKVGDTVRVMTKGNALEGSVARVLDISARQFKNVWVKLDVMPLDSRNSNNWFLENNLELVEA